MDVKNTLEFDSLYLEFGFKKILQDVYMSCEQGEVVGLLGRNGSGKSCLMKIVTGSMTVNQQSVRLNGNYLSKKAKLKHLSYLPQESFIPPFLTPRKVLQHYKAEPELLLSYFPFFSTKLNKPFGELSGGEGRLLEVFIILASKGHFCILDEPFSNLMPVHIDKIIELIDECRVSKGIIITDHLYRLMKPVCNRLYMLHEGKTIPIAKQDELIRFGYLPEKWMG